MSDRSVFPRDEEKLDDKLLENDKNYYTNIP